MDECVEHSGRKDRHGYGKVKFRGTRDFAAHRAAWIEANGEVPEGMHVLHWCDNRACVNVGHLHLGTHADNMREMAERGRSTAGERNPSARLTAEQAAEIRRRYVRGLGVALAREFGISKSQVQRIAAGNKWNRRETVD